MIKTFHYKDFIPVNRIIDTKDENGITISVVIPVKNEEKTIEHIVSIVVEQKNKFGIIDEIVVMDCCSDDATAILAANAGAKVVSIESTKPDINGITGKGAAIWKSQYVVNGDIILFVDGDIIDFDERFIIGLIGPLLFNGTLEIVKAAYRRPLIAEEKIIENYGGRVTELLVRPLINMFIPELSEIRQPLAGEYSVRKKTLEKLELYAGYGIDLGLLLEYYYNFGIASIGQVEMEIRSHRNRSLLELSKMGFEIEDVFFNYLEQNSIPSFYDIRNRKIKLWDNDMWNEYDVKNIKLTSKYFYNTNKHDYR